jgi:hypothetical protein
MSCQGVFKPHASNTYLVPYNPSREVYIMRETIKQLQSEMEELIRIHTLEMVTLREKLASIINSEDEQASKNLKPRSTIHQQIV